MAKSGDCPGKEPTKVCIVHGRDCGGSPVGRESKFAESCFWNPLLGKDFPGDGEEEWSARVNA